MQHLDTLIAFATVMLGTSLLITVWTQMISALLALRGSNLRWGLKTLLENSDPVLRSHARAITEAVLHHPLVSDSTLSTRATSFQTLTRRWRLANGVQKVELLGLLKSLAQEPKPDKARNDWTWQEALHNALNQPKEYAHHVLADIETWFDSTMLRVRQRFAMHARLWTMAAALLVAFGLHLDSIDLLQRLSTDAALRSSLMAQSAALEKVGNELLTASTNTIATATATNQQTQAKADLEKLEQTGNQLAGLLEKGGLRLLPDRTRHGGRCFAWWGESFSKRHLLGMLVTVALLSLGAPFWFQALKSLSSLRPILARHMEKETESATSGTNTTG